MHQTTQTQIDLRAQQLYFDFAVQSERYRLNLDIFGVRLLNAIGVAWHLDQRLTVLKVIHDFQHESSVSSTYRRLSQLKAKKLVSYTLDVEDERFKIVAPTQLAIDYFNDMGRVMNQLQRLEVG